MHPGSRILIYVLAALVIPGLSFFLAAILLALALGFIARLGRHPLHLVWRTRWLLLILVVGYGFSQPGEAAWPLLGEGSPTWSGLVLGAERAFHLMVLLLWLDVLVLSQSGDQLLSGLHGLMAPLAWMGLDSRRVALRLALTLKAIERLEQGEDQATEGGIRAGRGNLRHLFDPLPAQWLPEQVTLQAHPVRRRDVWVPLLLAGCGLFVWIGGWK